MTKGVKLKGSRDLLHSTRLSNRHAHWRSQGPIFIFVRWKRVNLAEEGPEPEILFLLLTLPLAFCRAVIPNLALAVPGSTYV